MPILTVAITIRKEKSFCKNAFLESDYFLTKAMKNHPYIILN